MSFSSRVTLAVFKRDFFSHFSSPTGYVFITLFVFLSAVAAFWQERFFQNNLANLDPLNAWFPYLLVFLCPAIAMGLWADERKQGTEELLLTMPARGGELIAGKYLAALGIYTMALAFSLSHVVVLFWLGKPDIGLLLSTYFGYWLAGAALLPLALLASQLTENLTVAFLMGGCFCAVPVFLYHANALLSGRAQRLCEQLSVIGQFRDLASGIVTLSAVVYFVCLGLSALYVSILITGRKRWPAPRAMGGHAFTRALAALAMTAALTSLTGQIGSRVDVTSEQIHSLSAGTKALIHSIDPNKAVFIQAYLSPEVPRAYLQARNNLIAFLREFSAEGREKIQTRIIETVKYSPAAREARERYGIQPFKVPVTEESASTINEIFMGLVITCGSEDFVIPFLDRGLPTEYELMRSIRVVSGAKRKRVGVLDTGARLFGGLDFTSKAQSQEWSIVAELKKQYDVQQLSPDAAYPADIDVLLAALPNTLAPPQLDRLTAYAKAGKPLLLLVDPLPSFNINQSPGAGEGANITPLLRAIGIDWPQQQVVWDTYNPHPQLRSIPPEVLFVGQGSGAPDAFQPKDETTSGLQEVVLLYAGNLKPTSDAKNFLPLLTTGKNSGALRWDQLVERSMLGELTMLQGQAHNSKGETFTPAARSGNAIVIADADLIGEQFFELRKRGVENLNFDNITFVLNAVDSLAGDKAFIALRKRRPRHRTLEALEARTRSFEQKRVEETQAAQGNAEKQLQEAQTRLDLAVRQIDARQDLDDQAKQIMITSVQQTETRRLTVARANVDDERQRQIENARANMEASVRGIQNTIKLLAVTLPPVPAFVLFILVSLNRLRRERIGVASDRLVSGGKS